MDTKLRKAWIVVGIAVLLATLVSAQEKPAEETHQEKRAFKTFQDRESYAMGVEMFRNLKRQGFEVDLNMLIAGMQDAYSGGKLALTDEQMLELLNASTSQAIINRTSDKLMVGENNKKKEAEFVAQNAKKAGVVTLPSGLQYKILKDAQGKHPAAGDMVEVNYRGTLLDGTQFENTYGGSHPAEFKVSDPHLIAGLREALKLMPVGAKWQLFIPARLAYGQRSAGKAIGPYSMLVYELELVAIK